MEDRWDDRLNKMMASWEQNSRGMADQSRGKQVLVEEETSLGRPNLISEEKVQPPLNGETMIEIITWQGPSGDLQSMDQEVDPSSKKP